MEHDKSPKKEHQCSEPPCKKNDAIIAQCETICRELLKCTEKKDVKPKKEREPLEGVTEYLIFWN